MMTATADDLLILPYTSGTTGKPKACMHSHRSVLFTAVLQARWYRLGGDDVMTAFMPLFHVAGMQGSMNSAISIGATLVLMARWDKDLIPDLFATYGVTFWNAAPTMIVDVLASPHFRDDCFAQLKVLTGGGAAMPVAVAERLKTRFGLEFAEGYGMTETMSPTHINPLDAPKRQCLGIAVHETDARVIDPETLAELGDDAVGEIVVHGPQVLRGYWKRPEADAIAFIEIDGKRLLRTGDLGYRDADGYFFAVDRLKRMINVSGFKVWPAEVEAAMYQHPAIRECCIISSPDPYRGETVKVLVALHDAAKTGVSADDILSWARGRMASYKVPRALVFVDRLPRSESNKISWKLLQDAEWGR
jgi:fatty-acyl-CoA synthase